MTVVPIITPPVKPKRTSVPDKPKDKPSKPK